MKVKNDFPDADLTFKKLRRYVQTIQERKTREQSPEQIEFYDECLGYVEEFISSIERYLDSVCNSESRIEKIKQSGADIKDIQDFADSEDQKRTNHHSLIIINMIMIDKTALYHGLDKVFNYAEEFEQEHSKLLPKDKIEKRQMSERERIKRRELGNFGLYLAATATAGMSRENMISDKEAREFANCESDNVKTNYDVFSKIKDSSKRIKGNMNDMIK